MICFQAESLSHHVQTDRTDRALMKPLNAKQEAIVSISADDESSPLKPKSCSALAHATSARYDLLKYLNEQ